MLVFAWCRIHRCVWYSAELRRSHKTHQATEPYSLLDSCQNAPLKWCSKKHYTLLKRALASHCNTLQHTATYCNTLQHTATHYNTLQHSATHYNTLRHSATHCNTLQHKMHLRNWYIFGTNHFKMISDVRQKWKNQLGWLINPVRHDLVRRMRFWRPKICRTWF